MAWYTSQSLSGSYNASPPAEDSSQVAANQVTWSKYKTKLHDYVSTLLNAIQTQAAAAVASANTAFYNRKYNYFSATAPSSPVAGQIWADSSASPDLLLKIYDGSSWITMAYCDNADTVFGRVYPKANTITQSNYINPLVSSAKLKDSLGTPQTSAVSSGGRGGAGVDAYSFWPMMYNTLQNTYVTGYPTQGGVGQARVGFYNVNPYTFVVRFRKIDTS